MVALSGARQGMGSVMAIGVKAAIGIVRLTQIHTALAN